MKIFKKNNKGMSLIEVIVAMGVMGILSYAMIEMISNQNKAIKTAQNSIDLNEIQNQLQRYMLDSEICKSTLQNTTFLPGAEVQINSIKKGTSILLSTTAPNNKLGGIEIQSLKVKRLAAPNDKELELTASLKKSITGNSYAGDNFTRTVKLSAQFLTAPANQIKNCYSQLDNAVISAVQMACEQICGPTCWNPTTQTCVRPTGTVAIYKNPVNGQLTDQSVVYRDFQVDGSNYCNCYNPGCPGGTSQLGGHWCTSGGVTSHCGFSRWKYGHVNCRQTYNLSPIGYLTPTP